MAASSRSPGANANILIRLVVGGVFLNEGILKFLEPAVYAAGRFKDIGLPHPELLGPFVAAVEVLGGALVILGLWSRWAALALFLHISVAIVTTKVPLLLGHAYWGLSLMKLKSYGVLSMVHEARTDLAMWFGLLFLLVAGPGRWALDALSGGKKAAAGP